MQTQDKQETIFQGDVKLKKSSRKNYITAAHAFRSLKKGAKGFLVYALNASAETPSIEDIPVVRDFKDVFPDKLLGLPPSREVEFEIDLIPVVEPISKAPHRMAP